MGLIRDTTGAQGVDPNPSTNAAATVQKTIVDLILFDMRSSPFMRVIPKNMDSVYFNRMWSKGLLTDPPASGIPAAPADELGKDNIRIDVTEQQYYYRANPIRDWENDWMHLWSTGQLTEAQFAGLVKNEIQKLSTQRIQEIMEVNFWSGGATTSAGAPIVVNDGYGQQINNRFIGVRRWLEILHYQNTTLTPTPTPITNPFDVPNLITSTAITKANVLDELDKVIAKIPYRVKAKGGIKILCSDKILDAYGEAQQDADIYKGTNFLGDFTRTYRGYPLTAVGCLEDEIYAGHFGTSETDQFQAATWMTQDYNSVKFGKLQADAEVWFYKALFKFGIGVLKPSEMVYYGQAMEDGPDT